VIVAVASGEILTAQDYALLGIQKIARQAARDPTTIRCPRDGAVMRVLTPATVRIDAEFDVECPACRRRATGVRLADAAGPEQVPAES